MPDGYIPDNTLDREIVIDRMMKMINGPHGDNQRMGYLTRERAAHTLDIWKGQMGIPGLMGKSGGFEPFAAEHPIAKAHLTKDVTQATGLTYYDLRAPALNLFPTVTPLRNAIPRRNMPHPGTALNWKAVLATIGSGFPYMGWVPEGRRTASMSYTTANQSASYATLGEEDSITDEARYAAIGFEDEDALVQLRLMLKSFVKEESAILGGNNSLTVTKPTAPTLSETTNAAATLPAATYYVKVVALTQEGLLNSSVSGGVATTMTVTGNDGKTYTLNGGSSAASNESSQAITLGEQLNCSTPYVNGAVAYAWYVGTATGAETLQAITSINSIAFILASQYTTGGQAVTAAAADHSNNNGLAFNGILTTAYVSGNSYIVSLGTGVAGTGSFLTPSGAGGIMEIDAMLKGMWDEFRISPTVIYVNSQELINITQGVLSSSSGSLLRYNTEADQQGMVEYKLTAAGVISFYFNPFTADGGMRIPIKLHPNLAAGTILGWSEQLPPWYVSNETPEVAEMITRQDYYNVAWPKTDRQQYYGVYCQEALAVYAPFALGIITNIGNGINT